MIFKAQQGHNNARTQERLSVKNTQTSNGEKGTYVRYLKRFEMHMNVLPFRRKTYSYFQQVQLRKNTSERQQNWWMGGRTSCHLKISLSSLYISCPAFPFKSWAKRLKPKTIWKHWREELIYGSMEILTSFYLRERQFDHVDITSKHQQASVICLRNFFNWWKKEMRNALKLLISNISNGILPLDHKTVSLLKQ